MDYRPPPSSYKGSIAPTQYHHHHNQELEWMSRISASSNTNNNPSSTPTRIEILDEEDDGGGDENTKSVVIEREHMFDKVVTPSDVGKLNRLVIPKQHAEKYFPLDSSNNEKGLLLNFEDRTGKHWRFRYSYWNSSQSYVMTKGWSRFVKEKKLDAGDIVSFQRGVGDIGKDKLFIDWRRRPDATSGLLPYPSPGGGAGLYSHHHHYHSQGPTIPGMAWGTSTTSSPFVLRSHPHPHQPYSYPLGLQGGPSGIWDQQGVPPHPTPHLSTMSLMNVLPSTQTYHQPARRGSDLGSGGGFGFGFGNVVNPTYPVIFLRPSSTTTNVGLGSLSSLSEDEQRVGVGSGTPLMMMQVQGEEGGEEGMVYESVPVVQGKAAAKRLRLFGVNMDCPISHQTHDFDILSSSLASSSTLNHQPHHQLNNQNVAFSMALPSSPPPHQPLRQLLSSSSPSPSSLYNGSSSSVPLEKGKSSTSSSMSLDLDI